MTTQQILHNFNQLLNNNPCWFVVQERNWPVHDPMTKMEYAMNQKHLAQLEPEERFWFIWKYRNWRVKAWYIDDLEEVSLEEIVIT